jgi:Tfp pilus assembly protein PilO
MKLTFTRSRKTIFFYSLCLIVFLVLMVHFVYIPLVNNLIKKRARFMLSSSTLQKRTSEIEEIERMKQENTLLKKELEKYSGVKQEKITSFILKSLLQAASSSGVEFISIDPIDIRDRNGFKYLKLEAKTKSGFHQLARFISEVRRLTGLFFVDSIETETEGSHLISEIMVSVYISPE